MINKQELGMHVHLSSFLKSVHSIKHSLCGCVQHYSVLENTAAVLCFCAVYMSARAESFLFLRACLQNICLLVLSWDLSICSLHSAFSDTTSVLIRQHEIEPNRNTERGRLQLN